MKKFLLFILIHSFVCIAIEKERYIIEGSNLRDRDFKLNYEIITRYNNTLLLRFHCNEDDCNIKGGIDNISILNLEEKIHLDLVKYNNRTRVEYLTKTSDNRYVLFNHFTSALLLTYRPHYNVIHKNMMVIDMLYMNIMHIGDLMTELMINNKEFIIFKTKNYPNGKENINIFLPNLSKVKTYDSLSTEIHLFHDSNKHLIIYSKDKNKLILYDTEKDKETIFEYKEHYKPVEFKLEKEILILRNPDNNEIYAIKNNVIDE